MRYIRKVLAALRCADEKFALIDKGDRILLGISGGKDSLCLLKAMSIYGLFAHKKFTIIPAIIDLGFDGFDPEPLKEYCKSLNLELVVDDSKFVYQALKDNQKDGKHLPCSICSRMKKAAMTNLANKLGCNKVAFAHHKDDAIETLFMNMIHGGRVATFEPKMYLSKSKITFIRPLIFATEMQLTLMTEEENLPVLPSHCPADKHTDRENIKSILNNLYSQYPECEKNFEDMLVNYDQLKLYFERLEFVNPDDGYLSLRPLTNHNDVISYYVLKEKNSCLTTIKEKLTTYLLRYKHQLIGRISYDLENNHDCTIEAFEIIDKYESKSSVVLKHFMDMMSASCNPITFIYKAKNKRLAVMNGFHKFNKSYICKRKIG